MTGHISSIDISNDIIKISAGVKTFYAYFDIDIHSHLTVGMKVEFIVTGEDVEDGKIVGSCIISQVLQGGLRLV